MELNTRHFTDNERSLKKQLLLKKVIYSVAYLVSELPLRPKDTYSFTYTIKSIYLVSTTHGNYCTIQNRDNTHTKCKVLGTGVIRERLIDEAKYSNSSH